MKKTLLFFLFPAIAFLSSCNHKAHKQDELIFNYKPRTTNVINMNRFEFNGYTDHWDKYNWTWNTYAGLFDESDLDVESDLWQMEMAQGNKLLLEELWIQPGFVNDLHKSLNVETLHATSLLDKKTLLNKLISENILLIGADRDSLIKDLVLKLPQDLQYRRTRAFMLNGRDAMHGVSTAGHLFVIASQTAIEAEKLYNYITSTLDVISKYKPYKGWAGVKTNYLLITQHVNSPYTVIDRALKMGCSWLMLDGYNDNMLTDPANKELSALNFPFVLLPGQYGTGGIMYGTKTFPDVQDNTELQCLDWMQKNNGYFFAYLSNIKSKNAARFSGYVINSPADNTKLDSLKAPFITEAGAVDRQILPSMVLFLRPDETLQKASIMKAIIERRSLAVFPKAEFYGDSKFVNAMRILLLDRDYLESELLSPSCVKCDIKDNVMNVDFANYRENQLGFNYKLLLPSLVSIANNHKNGSLTLQSCNANTLHFPLSIKPEACGKELPLGVEVDYPDGRKPLYSVCLLDVPPAVEASPLMFDVPGNIDYPVTIWNYSNNKNVDVNLTIKSTNQQINKSTNLKVIKSINQQIDVKNWHSKTVNFNFPLQEGDYIATVTALGLTHEGKISIRDENGNATVHTEDMNGDGIPEIVLENPKIRATILLFGGRVIEYILKENNEAQSTKHEARNMLFKLWPQTPPWEGKPEGKRAFYPYGGLEEFIGYPTIEGHIVFNYKILKAQGNYVRVKVWADIHGSKIEKIITLYGNSELLEVRYAFSDMDENIRIIGVNPLVRIGKTTGPEDTYYFPDINGKIEKRHPVKERYYGNTFHLREGWAAGYDSIEKISLLIGYPVNNAEIFHLWNNHPNNFPTPYYYTELQPWLLIKHGATTYFTYYLMGREGFYKPILDDFRKYGLVTTIR